MNRLLAVTGLGSALIIGAQALAVQPPSQSPGHKRELSDCMTRRMSANRSLSYNEALKACKDQTKDRKTTTASINPAGTANKAP
jgi:hypothetical protein